MTTDTSNEKKTKKDENRKKAEEAATHRKLKKIPTATATAYGNGKFVCWKEEGVVVSTSAEYTFTVDHNVKLVAYFAPNTDESSYPTGIQENVAEEVTVTVTDNSIVATGDVRSLELFTVKAALIANAKGNAMDTAGVPEGLYIVRATTAGGYKNVKVYIKK